MKQKGPKLVLQSVVPDLRLQGYKPLFDKDGRLVDWRRIRKHKLQTAKVTVHDSGRVSIIYRSSENGRKTGRKGDHRAGRKASSTREVDTSTT